MADDLASMLGVPLDYARGLLEAAGGDVAMAAELAFSQQDVDSSDATASASPSMTMNLSSSSPSFKEPYEQWSKIWPEQKELPPSWANQRLDNLTTDNKEGIIQDSNGPCGVLSVVQAELWMQEIFSDENNSKLSFNDRLSVAISRILSRVLSHSETCSSSIVRMIDGSEVKLEDASKNIRSAKALVETAVATYGIDKLKFLPGISLVEGPHWLCSSDLMCLLLRGYTGSGNFGAWDATTSLKRPFFSTTSGKEEEEENGRIGMLSYMEIEHKGTKVADDLKFVKSNVWLLHTGDHFTTMRLLSRKETEIIVEVYNGLPPEGPKFHQFKLTGDLTPVEPAAEKRVDTFKKKRPGQADDIVQAQKTNSTNYTDWTFEVVPAIDDPTVAGPIDDDPNEPIYNFDDLSKDVDETSPWRCATCYYTRFKTMNFGLNDSGMTCNACGGKRRDVFWSLWFPFHELSPRMKCRARQMYASKIELVISTLWPTAAIAL